MDEQVVEDELGLSLQTEAGTRTQLAYRFYLNCDSQSVSLDLRGSLRSFRGSSGETILY